MLTLAPPGHSHEAPPRTGFWCEAIAHTSDSRAFWLGSKPATTPRLALRWLRSRAQDIADQLDAPFARPVHAWIHDEREHERALDLLAHAETYVLTAYEETTRYTLTARPAHLGRPHV